MWRGTSSWQRTVQPVKLDGPGKSAGRQAREDSRSSKRRARFPRGGSEAEFVAASQAGQEVLYLRALLKGFAYL